MNTTMTFHLEKADQEFLWWVDSADAPGFYAAAETLCEVRRLAVAALVEMGFGDQFTEELADPDPEPGPSIGREGQRITVDLGRGTSPSTSESGSAERRMLVQSAA